LAVKASLRRTLSLAFQSFDMNGSPGEALKLVAQVYALLGDLRLMLIDVLFDLNQSGRVYRAGRLFAITIHGIGVGFDLPQKRLDVFQ
jgi:hypothetical protein